MLQKSEIVYKDSLYDVTLVIRQATFADGMRRAALHGEAIIAGEVLGYPGDLDALITLHIRPSCIAGLVSVENRGELVVKPEPTLQEFMEYPDSLVDLWQRAVWELNPHWSPFGFSQTQPTSSTENSNDGTPRKE